MAVRVLLVLAALAVLYGCDQASSPTEKQEKKEGAEEVGSKGNGEPSTEDPNITPPKDKTLRLTVPEMEMIKDDKIPTGLGTDKALFHDYAGVHFKNTGWPWEEEANVYISGHRLGYEGTNSYLAFWDLNKLEEGDEFYITDSEGRQYTYVVFRKYVTTPANLRVLNPVEGKNIVTLQTCTLPDYTNRLLIRAELEEIKEA